MFKMQPELEKQQQETAPLWQVQKPVLEYPTERREVMITKVFKVEVLKSANYTWKDFAVGK